MKPSGIRSVPPLSRRRGSMLIIAIGVLTLLAVLGTTFVSLMKLERQATRNYIDAQVVDLVNDSALDRVIAELRDATNHFSYTTYRAPWLYQVDDGRGNRYLAHGRHEIEDPRVGEWSVLHSDEGAKRVFRYKTKVIDCAAQLNINGKNDSLPRMIENLADAIVRSPWLKKDGQNPLWTGYPQRGELLKGIQIVEFRNKLEGHRFRSKTQLRELIGSENYETIKDFITLHSWEDPYTFGPSDGIDDVDILQLGRAGGGRAIGGGNRGMAVHSPVANPSPLVRWEPRSPINVNTAPEEVLVAALIGVGGRRPFPYARLIYSAIDQKAAILGQKVIGQEENQDMLPRGVWVYMLPLRYDHAVKIARKIVEQRKSPAGQFRAWSTGRAAQPGFVEFINALDESFFPNPATARVVDPANPEDRRVQADIIGGGTEISFLWRKGHDASEQQLRRESGQPFHRQNAFYYELCKAAVIANFNPNTRINHINPNAPAYTPVDKAGLVVIDQQDQRTPRKGYTTEFCFDSMGVYEITTLGELSQATGGVGPAAAAAYEPIFRKKVSTVVKVFDVIRHTSQFHFEQTFSNRFGLSSRNNRRNVVTWPDPVEALTEVVTAGSKLDGRIELAGLKDGLRLQLPHASRPQAYRSPEAIAMACGFMDRDDQSFATLRRLTSSGQTGNKAYADELGKVFDPNYSRISPIYTRRYTREELLLLGGGTSRTAINLEPKVDTVEFGTDLRPDGLHTSLFTTGHLGARFLLVPSHTRIGAGIGKSGRGALVGAGFRQPLSGNVPYYDGGVAFWVKFEFDGDDPVFSGLVGCTSVIEPVGMTPPKDSEGTQFYVFKNTKGQLRVVRMYYHQAFPPGGEGGDEGSGGGALWPPVEVDESGSSQNKDVLDLDPQKPVARADYVIDVRHFKAHDWHHIAVEWHDQSPNQAIQVYVDFEKVQGGGPFIPQEEIGSEPTAWVRLNCRDPKDGLFVGGFIRQQAVADAGVFKWYTNTLSQRSAGGIGGLQIIEPTVKKILANATIDEFVTFTGTFPGVRSYFTPRGAPGYFTNQTGDYANIMEIPLPAGVDQVVLRSFDWTSYSPTFYTGNNRQPQKLNAQEIQCQVLINSARQPGRFHESWRDGGSIENRVAGYEAGRARGTRPGTSADLVYRFSIPPARAQSGSLAGGSVQTPVIDDVTLTYYLADPKILHQQEVE